MSFFLSFYENKKHFYKRQKNLTKCIFKREEPKLVIIQFQSINAEEYYTKEMAEKSNFL